MKKIILILALIFMMAGNVEAKCPNKKAWCDTDISNTGDFNLTGDLAVSGTLGVGTTSPLGKVEVNETVTLSSFDARMFFDFIYNNSVELNNSVGNQLYTHSNRLTLTGSAGSDANVAVGVLRNTFRVTSDATFAAVLTQGNSATITNGSTATLTTAKTIASTMNPGTTGTITDGYVHWLESGNGGGTIGTITDLYINPGTYAGTTTLRYGAKIESPSHSGTLTTNNGLWIDLQTADTTARALIFGGDTTLDTSDASAWFGASQDATVEWGNRITSVDSHVIDPNRNDTTKTDDLAVNSDQFSYIMDAQILDIISSDAGYAAGEVKVLLNMSNGDNGATETNYAPPTVQDFSRGTVLTVLLKGTGYLFQGSASDTDIVASSDHADFFMSSGGVDIDFTLCSLIKVSDQSGNQIIASKWQDGGEEEYKLYLDSAEKVNMILQDVSDANSTLENITTSGLTDGGFNFICMAYDEDAGAQDITLYVNGVDDTAGNDTNTGTYGSAMDDGDASFVYGNSWFATPDESFFGQIGTSFTVKGTALSAETIWKLWLIIKGHYAL